MRRRECKHRGSRAKRSLFRTKRCRSTSKESPAFLTTSVDPQSRPDFVKKLIWLVDRDIKNFWVTWQESLPPSLVPAHMTVLSKMWLMNSLSLWYLVRQSSFGTIGIATSLKEGEFSPPALVVPHPATYGNGQKVSRERKAAVIGRQIGWTKSERPSYIQLYKFIKFHLKK